MNETTFIDAQYKDSSPAATVAHIKQLLASYGIEVEESWRQTCVPYCYALSGRVVGTTFGTNGKGLSEEFALASCYGELMERLQLGYVYSPNIQKDGTSYDRTRKDSMKMDQLLSEHPNWYQLMSDKLKQYTGVSMSAQEILKQYTDKDGNLSVTSYYCLNTGEVAHFPNAIKGKVYTTNGSAAGNTPEEALVQAISEIVERRYKELINDGGISLPDIPEETLQSFETAYRIISFIREQGYRVVVKDASLGDSFPVICVYIIDLHTGRYHTHFGAYPITEIALERALTESFQGRTIRDIAYHEDLLFKKPGEFSFASASNEFVRGTHEKTLNFFVGEPTYPYNEKMGFQGKGNKELLKECVEFFTRQGYDLLVQDQSCLGFPTYQVIIPGYSEVFVHRLSTKMDEHRYAQSAVRVLTNPSAAQLPDYMGFLMHEEEMKKYTSNITSVHSFMAKSKLSATAPADLERFLMNASKGYVFYGLGKLDQAAACVDAMIPHAKTEEADFLICLKRYLSMVIHRRSKEETEALLRYLHRQETVDKLYGILAKRQNPLDEFTLHCDQIQCEGCRLSQHCCQKRVNELASLLHEKRQQLDFDQFCRTMKDLVSC